MKKIPVLFIIICCTNMAYAQTLSTVTASGNSTIYALRVTGGSNIGPATDAGMVIGVLNLPMVGDARSFVGWKNSANPNYTTDGPAGTLLLQARSNLANVPIDFVTGVTSSIIPPQLRMRIAGNGKVGIGGISVPLAQLHVVGDVYTDGKLFIGVPDANTLTKMGTNALAVDGYAIFTKATVKLSSAWPDYVFDPTYNLTSLDSLEQFIQLNKRLPEIPSATDVEKDGIDLGGTQALLLKKIEELTLIVIEQNKRIEGLEKDSKGNKEK